MSSTDRTDPGHSDGRPLDDGESVLGDAADWGPQEDWSDWTDATRRGPCRRDTAPEPDGDAT